MPRIPATGFGEAFLLGADCMQYRLDQITLPWKEVEMLRAQLEHFRVKNVRRLSEIGLGFLLQSGQAQWRGEDVVFAKTYDEILHSPVKFELGIEKAPADRVITTGDSPLDGAVGTVLEHFCIKSIEDIALYQLGLLHQVVEAQQTGWNVETTSGQEIRLDGALDPKIVAEMRKGPRHALSPARWANSLRLWLNDVA